MQEGTAQVHICRMAMERLAQQSWNLRCFSLASFPYLILLKYCLLYTLRCNRLGDKKKILRKAQSTLSSKGNPKDTAVHNVSEALGFVSQASHKTKYIPMTLLRKPQNLQNRLRRWACDHGRAHKLQYVLVMCIFVSVSRISRSTPIIPATPICRKQPTLAYIVPLQETLQETLLFPVFKHSRRGQDNCRLDGVHVRRCLCEGQHLLMLPVCVMVLRLKGGAGDRGVPAVVCGQPVKNGGMPDGSTQGCAQALGVHIASEDVREEGGMRYRLRSSRGSSRDNARRDEHITTRSTTRPANTTHASNESVGDGRGEGRARRRYPICKRTVRGDNSSSYGT
jgi:hypothetical protein